MDIREQVITAVTELVTTERSNFRPVSLLVVGCSSSEIGGGTIGHSSSAEIGAKVVDALLECAQQYRFALAFQCCEHLNRALVMERAEALCRGYEPVCVVPQLKAGGSLATNAWQRLTDPVAVEQISADAGIDIGRTLIGMHLKAVAVPVRLKQEMIGKADVTAARTRPKLIGGERARYE